MILFIFQVIQKKKKKKKKKKNKNKLLNSQLWPN